MKIAVIGSRELKVNDLEKYLPVGVTEIVSGGAKGINSTSKSSTNSSGRISANISRRVIRTSRSAIQSSNCLSKQGTGTGQGRKIKKDGLLVTVTHLKPLFDFLFQMIENI